MDLSEKIHLLGDILGEVIYAHESPRLFSLVEQIRDLAKQRRVGVQDSTVSLDEIVKALSNAEARGVAAAFSLYFDLVNLAEEDQRVSTLRLQQVERYPEPPRESIAEAVQLLHEQGVSPAQMQAILERLSIELVLTAHPTEARRRTILSKVHRIGGALRSLDASGLLPGEIAALRRELHEEISAFWLSERVRTARPAVTDEVRTGLYTIDTILWEALPHIYADLDTALERYYPGLVLKHAWLRFASWIGGDRDGNPNVTTPVTAETLRLHRGLAVEKHRTALQELARQLSLSGKRVPPPAELLAWLEERRPFPPHVAFLEKRYAHEPYRLLLSLLADDLAQASKEDMLSNLLTNQPGPARAHLTVFEEALALVRQSLPPPLNSGRILAVTRQLQIFGLQTARLDLREDAQRLNAALGEILRGLGVHPSFEHAPGDERLNLLARLLAEPLPPLAPQPGITPETAETWALFQLISRARLVYGVQVFGPFIISMTRHAADLLAVLLLARWTGSDDSLEIVPLFETLQSLAQAPEILNSVFQQPAYRTHLDSCGNHQMVMIGYSDSNKEGGYLAANWALYQAQENVARICRQQGIDFSLFHGRGGTVARGGGPANRAIRAQPPGSVNAHFRLTEQGEIIFSRYANPALAHRHLEQIVSAVLLASAAQAPDSQQIPTRQMRLAMQNMAEAALQAYRSLVYETPGFLEYWQAVTPIVSINHLLIGSRPDARRPGSLAVTNIRAIPWVFSWMQSRFNLPGWYGLGSGLEALLKPADQDWGILLLRQMYAEWPLFRTLLDNAEMSLLKADMQIAALYSDLAPDQELAAKIYNLVLEEYERTRRVLLEISGHTALMEAEPVIQRSVNLRNPYVDPLNFIQVEMLRRLRAQPPHEKGENELSQDVLTLTINGIASALRNTG